MIKMPNSNEPISSQQGLPGTTSSSAELYCPKCLEVLDITDSFLECQKCDMPFPISYKMPKFGGNELVFSKFSGMGRSKLRTLLDQIDTNGFLKAINVFFAKSGESARDSFFRSTFNLRRNAWMNTLELPDDAVALDLGCGKGVGSIGLARHCKQVVGYDLSVERVAFLQRWADYEGLINVQCLCGSDDEFLPFGNGTFDIVVMNGVFDWAGYGRSRSPIECHARLLREVRRILKASGQLYVGSENKIGYPYLFDKKENGTGNILSNLVSRIFPTVFPREDRKTSHSVYTYTSDGLKKLLQRCGFPHVSFYSLFPDYCYLRQIASLDGRTHLTPPKSSHRLKSLLHQVMCLPKALRYFSPFLGVIASSAQANSSLLQTMIKRLGLSMDLEVHLLVSKTGMTTARARTLNGEKVIVRLAHSLAGKERCETNARRLREIHNDSTVPESFKLCVPRLVANTVCKGQLATAETMVPGISLDRITEKRLNIVWHSLVGLILPWSLAGIEQEATGTTSSRANVLRSWVLDVTRIIPKNKHKDALTGFLNKTEIELNEMPEFTVLTHGDCHPGNVLVDENSGEVSGLIDWDIEVPSAPPFFDLLNFAIRAEYGGDLIHGLLPLRINAAWQNHLSDLVHRFDLPGDFMTYLQKFYVLWRIAERLDEPILNPRRVDRAIQLLHWFSIAQDCR